VKGPLHNDDPLRPFAQDTVHETGVYAYGSAPGPLNFGESVPPEHIHSAADAVPIGFRNASARCIVELFGAGALKATPEPLVLLSAPLTTLTATSELDGLFEDVAALEQASALQARRAHETNGTT
jgi:hypothetical protein